MCPRCGRKYTAAPALSREDGKTKICPVCGVGESLIPLELDEDQKTMILQEIENLERNEGRIE